MRDISYDAIRDVADTLLDLHRISEGLEPDERLTRIMEELETLALEDAGDDPDEQAEYLWLLERFLASEAERIAATRKAASNLLMRNVGKHGAIRLGDNAYKAAPDKAWEIPDLDAFVHWVKHHDPDSGLEDVFRLGADTMRVTAVRAIAKRAYKADHPDAEDSVIDAYARSVEQTFLKYADRGDGGYRLDTVYPGKAIWAQRLEHRQRDPKRIPKRDRCKHCLGEGLSSAALLKVAGHEDEACPHCNGSGLEPAPWEDNE